jgi:hypothetical protein
MKKTIKGYIAGFVTAILLIALATGVYAAARNESISVFYNNIRLIVNGELITPRDGLGNVVEPFIFNGTTFLPVRAVAEALGQNVEWDGATQTVYIGTRPGSVQYLTDVVPAHQTNAGNSYKEFSALQSGGVDRFSLGGVTYTNGMTFRHGNELWAVYNLNGRFTSLSGIVSQLDGVSNSDDHAVIRFLVDGRMVLEIPIAGHMSPQDFNINLLGGNQLRIETSTGGRGGNVNVGIGNPVIE